MNEKICPHCKIDLVIGKSLDSQDPNLRTEYLYFDKGELKTCWKCPKCGHSETLCG